MIFHLSLSDDKSPQVSRSLLSILANLNNAVVWMVLAYSLISSSSSLLPSLWRLFQVHLLQLVSLSPSCSIVFFNSLTRSKYILLFFVFFGFHSINFTPWEFFTSVLSDCLSLESEWPQVSSSLQNSSQCFGWSQQCCSLDCLHSSSYFQIL